MLEPGDALELVLRQWWCDGDRDHRGESENEIDGNTKQPTHEIFGCRIATPQSIMSFLLLGTPRDLGTGSESPRAILLIARYIVSWRRTLRAAIHGMARTLDLLGCVVDQARLWPPATC